MLSWHQKPSFSLHLPRLGPLLTRYEERARRQLLQENHALATEPASEHNQHRTGLDTCLKLGRFLNVARTATRDRDVVSRVEPRRLARSRRGRRSLLPALAEEPIPPPLLHSLH